MNFIRAYYIYLNIFFHGIYYTEFGGSLIYIYNIYIKYMLLYWIYFLCRLGRAGENWRPLYVMDDQSRDRFDWFRSTGYFLVLTFYFLCWLWPLGLKSLWGESGWKFFWLWVFPHVPIVRGLNRIHTPTAGAVRWYDVSEPWTPGCRSV